MNKARITYRFDRFQREKRDGLETPDGGAADSPPAEDGLIEPLVLNRYTTHFGEWVSPFDKETERLERLIREAGERVATGAPRARSLDGDSPERRNSDGGNDEAVFQDSGVGGVGGVGGIDGIGGLGGTGTVSAENAVTNANPVAGAKERSLLARHTGMANGYEAYAAPTFGDDDRPEAYSWYLGPSVYDETGGKTRLTQSVRPPWFKIVASVAGAVATGVFFGFFILSMFSQDPQDGNGGVRAPAATNVGGADLQPSRDGASVALPDGQGRQPDAISSSDKTAVANANAAAVAVRLPERTYSLLQNGVFSSRQGADTAQAALRERGLAAVTEAADKFYVYVGIAANRSDAASLVNKLQLKPEEVYVKNYVLPEVKQVKWNGAASDALPGFLAEGDRLIRLMSEATVARLKEAQPSAIDETAMQQIRSAHQAWTGYAATVNDSAAGGVKPLLSPMNAAMNMAVLSLDKYAKDPAATYLWQAQSAIIQYVIAEKSLLAAIAVP